MTMREIQNLGVDIGQMGDSLLRLWEAGNQEMCWQLVSGMGLLPDFACWLASRRMGEYMCSEDEIRVYHCFGSVVVTGFYGGYGDECCWEFVVSRGLLDFMEWLDSDLGWFIRSEVDPCQQDILAADSDWEMELVWAEDRAHPGADSRNHCGDGYVTLDSDRYPVDEFYRWRPLC